MVSVGGQWRRDLQAAIVEPPDFHLHGAGERNVLQP
jgi:hypothetical protein